MEFVKEFCQYIVFSRDNTNKTVCLVNCVVQKKSHGSLNPWQICLIKWNLRENYFPLFFAITATIEQAIIPIANGIMNKKPTSQGALVK